MNGELTPKILDALNNMGFHIQVPIEYFSGIHEDVTFETVMIVEYKAPDGN